MESGKKIIIAQQIYSPGKASGATTEFEFVINNKEINRLFNVKTVVYSGTQGFLGHKAISFYKNEFARIKPDLVVIRGAGPDGYYAVLGAKKAKCKRILVGIHGLYSDITNISKFKKRLVNCFVEKPIFKKSTSFYTVCDDAYLIHPFLKKYRNKYLGTLYNPAPDYSDHLNSYGAFLYKKKNKKVGIYIGRLTFDKGTIFLSNALKKLFAKRDDFVFQFAGSGDSEEIIKKILDKEIREGKVKMLGVQQDVPNLLFKSDFFVFPSLRENHPFSILEAVASGIFIISTNVGGIKETIDQYKNKEYVLPSNTVSIENAIESFLNKKDYQRFDKTTRDVLNRFSSENATKALIDLYFKALGK